MPPLTFSPPLFLRRSGTCNMGLRDMVPMENVSTTEDCRTACAVAPWCASAAWNTQGRKRSILKAAQCILTRTCTDVPKGTHTAYITYVKVDCRAGATTTGSSSSTSAADEAAASQVAAIKQGLPWAAPHKGHHAVDEQPPSSSRNGTLGVLLMQRDECVLGMLREWLAHYRGQGVDHFYIVDHNSTDWDACPRRSLGRDITWWRWGVRTSDATLAGKNQDVVYNTYAPRAKTEWLLICDADELMFGAYDRTLAEVLRALPRHVHQLCVPWTNFGSSGLVSQPACVSGSNLYRKRLPLARELMNQPLGEGSLLVNHSLRSHDLVGKCVSRVRVVRFWSIHRAKLGDADPEQRGCVCPDLTSQCAPPAKGRPFSQACALFMAGRQDAQREQRLRASQVKLHHYGVQSVAAIRRKQQRGDVTARHRTKYASMASHSSYQ